MTVTHILIDRRAESHAAEPEAVNSSGSEPSSSRNQMTDG